MNPTATHIHALATTPILAVVCDFDGTLSHMTDHPGDAIPAEHALSQLHAIAALPRTYAGVISGRSLADLVARLGPAGRLTLIGGHGAEHAQQPPPESGGRREVELLAELGQLESAYAGAVLEPKPAGPALHYRHVDPAHRDRLLADAESLAARLGVVPLRHGIMVVEFPLLRANKGEAARGLIQQVGATAMVYVGDDRTDEDAFGVLHSPHLGVKVGPGPTSAATRLRNVDEVASFLGTLLQARAEHVSRDRPPAIDHHAMLSDQRSIALTAPSGRVVWFGTPCADSPPLFASLVGGAGAGYFEVLPGDESPDEPPQREYEGSTLITVSRYPRFSVTDYLDCSGGRAFQRAGRTDLIRVVEGSGPIRITFAPRLDFGRVSTRLRVLPEGLLVEGSVDPIVLLSPGVRWIIEPDGTHHTAVAELDIPAGGLPLELRVGTASMARGPSEAGRRKATAAFWNGWAAATRTTTLHSDLVRRSALVIKALCYGPSGAILAAGTTSLPEQLGGSRNWDYRFCWVRDAAMSAASLVRLGSTGHAMKFLDWLLAVVDDLDSPERLRPIYTVRGTELGPEGEVAELPGYECSRPVRVGNGAAHQVQLDVFGPVADLVCLMAECGAPLTPDHRRLLDAMVRAVARRWREPDHGIWEIRGPLRHHVHSKALCWHAVERAIRARELLGEPIREEEAALRDEIREDILARGYNPKVGAFTAYYGSTDLDAAAMLVGLTGLLPPRDDRFVSTVRTLEKRLRIGDGVLRYRYDDGLPGVEGAFHLCTGWLIESLWLIGDADRARALLDAYAAQAGPLGLYSEERELHTGRPLGNYPQAYSHLALINAAVRLGGVK